MKLTLLSAFPKATRAIMGPMTTVHLPLESKTLQTAFSIVKTLQEHGHAAYLVGGCVRDLVMGATPAEADVATSAPPAIVEELFSNTVAVGEQFGVVLVILDEKRFEVATFRSDAAYSDGRHPDSVAYSDTPEEDSRRRDFTINALYYDPIKHELFDYHDGQGDLRRRLIRAIGDPMARFQEDKLRLLRAVRFAVQFGFEIEPGTRQAVVDLASTVRVVSAERVRDELTRILTGGHAHQGFRLLDEMGLLEFWLPELKRMKGVKQPPEFHPEGDVWVHTLLLLERMDESKANAALEGSGPATQSTDLRAGSISLSGYPSPVLAWSGLLHDIGKPDTFECAPDRIRFNGHMELGAHMARQICRRLRMSNDETDAIAELVQEHLKFKDVFRMKTSTLKRFVRRPHFGDHLELHRLDCLASHGDLEAYHFTLNFARSLGPEEVRPKPFLTGEDLMELGYIPGPQFKKILTALEDAQLENQVVDRESAIQFVEKNFPRAVDD